MIDVVVNHMSPPGANNASFHSEDYTPFNSSKFYHAACGIDDSNKTSVEVCWQGSLEQGNALADLRTEDASVRNVWKKWIKHIVTKYKADGIRIDSLKHVEKDFYPGFMQAAGVFAVGEMLDGDSSNYPEWLQPNVSVDALLNYPM